MTKENSQNIEIKLRNKILENSDNSYDSKDLLNKRVREEYSDNEFATFNETSEDVASITPDHINNVMEFTCCTRDEAI